MTEDRSKLQLTVNILILCIYHNCIELEFLFDLKTVQYYFSLSPSLIH